MSYPTLTQPTFYQDPNIAPYIQQHPRPISPPNTQPTSPPQSPKVPETVVTTAPTLESSQEQLEQLKARRLNDLTTIINERDQAFENAEEQYDHMIGYIKVAVILAVIALAIVIIGPTLVNSHEAVKGLSWGALGLTVGSIGLLWFHNAAYDTPYHEGHTAGGDIRALYCSLEAQQAALKPYREEQYREEFVQRTLINHPEPAYNIRHSMQLPESYYPQFEG